MASSWEGGLDKGNVCSISWLVTTSQPLSRAVPARVSFLMTAGTSWQLFRFYMTFGPRPWVEERLWVWVLGRWGWSSLETLRFASSRAVARWSDADLTLPTVRPVARWLGSINTWLSFPISKHLKVLFIFQINSNTPFLCVLYSYSDLNYLSSLFQIPPSSLQFWVCSLSVVARKKMAPKAHRDWH